MSKPSIGTDEWVHHNPNRFGIYNRALDESGYFSPDGFFQPWSVCQGYDHRGNFDTHAEAIAHASKATSRPPEAAETFTHPTTPTAADKAAKPSTRTQKEQM